MSKVDTTKEKILNVVIAFSHVGLGPLDTINDIPMDSLVSCTVTVDKQEMGALLRIIDGISRVIASIWMDNSIDQDAYTELKMIADQLLNDIKNEENNGAS